MSFTIGIDVGGTNTDVAIIKGNTVVGWSKATTSSNITDGVSHALEVAVANATKDGFKDIITCVRRINIGTTHFINAVIKRTGLAKVVCLRLCGNATHALPPFSDFPHDLREVICGGHELLSGGFEFDEKLIAALDEHELLAALRKLSEAGCENVAISGVFSPTNPSHELALGKLLTEHFPGISYTLSHHLGYLGLLERENAAILNESLKPLCRKTISGFKTAFADMGLTCPVYFTQNDGTLLSESQTLELPVYTFSSGATNSMRGAAHLSGLKDAVVIDIGGTSTDIGVLVKGFPRESSTRVRVGGVNTNFRMPDTKSVGLGGGSLVTVDDHGVISVGPQSVEYRLVHEALVFGGTILVASDIAVARGLANFGDKTKVANLEAGFIEEVECVIRQRLEALIDQVKISPEDVPVILVGGGSVLIDTSVPLAGAAGLIKPPFYQVANAVGAALSQVSGTYDRLVSLKDGHTRESALDDAKRSAIDQCIEAGALPETVEILDIAQISMQYVAIPCVRLRVKAVGDIEKHAIGDIVLSMSDVAADDGTRRSHQEAVVNVAHAGDSAASKQVRFMQKVEQDYQPRINERGEWVLNEYDVECLAIGAGLRGCGGGGSPYLGRLRLMKCVENGRPPRIIHPFRMTGDKLACSVAFMGAPEAMIERLASGNELPLALSKTEKLMKMGFHGTLTDEEIEKLAEANHLKLWREGSALLTTIPDEDEDLSSQKPFAIMVAEIGGLNSIEPLIVGADCDLPILDCDGMGRAFPQLQHFGPYIYGKPPYPAVLTDVHNKNVCCLKVDSATELENVFRGHAIQMGCSAGLGLGGLTAEDIRSRCCLFTLSRTWRNGNAVMMARRRQEDPVEAILKLEDGVLLTKGKVLDVRRETARGYTWGTLIVGGFAGFPGLHVDFQNEYIIARSLESQTVLATVPDMICTVDVDSGEPITAEELKYGLRMAVFVIPAPSIINTDQAHKYVSPEKFGYVGVPYTKRCTYKEMAPFPPYME